MWKRFLKYPRTWRCLANWRFACTTTQCKHTWYASTSFTAHLPVILVAAISEKRYWILNMLCQTLQSYLQINMCFSNTTSFTTPQLYYYFRLTRRSACLSHCLGPSHPSQSKCCHHIDSSLSHAVLPALHLPPLPHLLFPRPITASFCPYLFLAT